jgi:hypothetical protein
MRADTVQGYMTALRTQPFIFDGRLSGRHFPMGHSVEIEFLGPTLNDQAEAVRPV